MYDRPDRMVSTPSARVLAVCLAAVLVPAAALANDAEVPEETFSEEIVVTATRTENEIADAPASVSLLTEEDIVLTVATDVRDAVRQTPGITFQGRGVGGRQAVSIRGMSSDSALFLIDGRRTLVTDNVFGHSNFQYNWMPMNIINTIEVVRGPMSALYGSDAMGGVINLTTKPAPHSWAGTFSTRYGSAEREGDEPYAGLYLTGPLSDRAGVLMSYTYNDIEEVPLEEDPSLTELEGRESGNLFARLSFQPADNHSLYVDYANTDERRNQFTRSRSGVGYESIYDLDKFQLGAGYQGYVNKTTVSLGAYFAEFDQINSRTQGQRPSTPQTLKHGVIDGHAIFSAGEDHRVLIGAEAREETLVHPNIAGGEGSILFLSGFVQDEWTLSDAATLTIGGRLDDHENFGSELSPRIYLVYHVSDTWAVKGGYSHGFRSPTIKRSSPEYQFIGPHNFIGNADVGPETSDNYELNLSYFGDRGSFSITAFQNEVDDLIDTFCIENCTARLGRTFTYVNVAEAETSGVETLFNVALNDQWSLEASHVYLDTEDKTTGLELDQRPDNTINTALGWRAPDGALSARLRGEYIGDSVSNSSSGPLDLPAYTLYHAHGSWVANDLFTLNFGVKNLTDVSLAEESDFYGYAERGRTYYLGFDLSFWR